MAGEASAQGCVGKTCRRAGQCGRFSTKDLFLQESAHSMPSGVVGFTPIQNHDDAIASAERRASSMRN